MIIPFVILVAIVVFVVINQFLLNNQNAHLISKLIASAAFVSFSVLNINSLGSSSSSLIPYAILISQLFALLGDLSNALYLTNVSYVHLAGNFFSIAQTLLITISAVTSVEQGLLPLLSTYPTWQAIAINVLIVALVAYALTYYVFVNWFNVSLTTILPPTDRLRSDSFFYMVVVVVSTIAAVANYVLQFLKVQDLINAGQSVVSLEPVSTFLLKYGIGSLLLLVNSYAVISFVFVPVTFLTTVAFRNYLYVRLMVYYIAQLLISWSIVNL